MASSARIDELKKKFDENPRRYFAPLANEYRKVGDLDQALFICEAYLPQQPGHMSGHIVYAQTLFEMGRYDDSKAAFGAALALDPENLIALRHLGDIAREAGDLHTAREWYQRVLEADPRNEEIVEVMGSLRHVTTGGAAPGSPTVSAAAEAPPSMRTPPVSAQPPVYSAPTPASRLPVSPSTDEVEEGDELLDLDSMMLGETPLSTPAVPAAPVSDDAPFESDPFAIAANGPPRIELATDLHLGLVDDGTQSDVAPTTDTPPLEGLRSFEAGTLPERAEIVDSSLEMEPFYDILHGEAAPPDEPETKDAATLHDDAPADSVGAEAVVRVPTPPAGEIFVTETMAELYLQQGHLDSALDIYRKLHEQRPDDARLIERVRSLEDRVFGPPAGAAPSGQELELDEVLGTTAPGSGPTIREFLIGLIGRRDATSSQSNGSSHDGSAELPVLSRHTLPGSIDAMFPQADSSAVDSSAATALGEAFGMDDFDVDLPSDSGHRSTDSSVDPVASGNPPPLSQAAPAGFSFDQFFSADATSVPPRSSGEMGAAPVESPDDIAQFNAWLNGLKKT